MDENMSPGAHCEENHGLLSELINSLQIEASSLTVEVKNLEKKTDDQEQ